MEIVERKITDLIHAEYNPRELTEDQEKHQRKIARFNNTLFSGEADARKKVLRHGT